MRLDVDAEKWGWYRSKDILLGRTMDKKPAPDSLLKTLGCNRKGDCSALRCGCRKGGYHCSSLCGQCQTDGCTNEHIIPEENDDELDDFDNLELNI